MSWLFSQALVEEYSAGTSLAGAPCAQLNVMPTPQTFWRLDKMIEPSGHSRFGLTSQVLMESHGAELLMSFLADFPVRTSAPRALVQESKANEVVCGRTWPGLLAKFDRASSTWRTAQYSLLADSDVYLETWPRWGLMRTGASYLRPIPALPICVSSMTKEMALNGGYNQKGQKRQIGLENAVKYWPTPRARDAQPEGLEAGKRRIEKYSTCGLQTAVSLNGEECGLGPLNPAWVEWLMGWPIGWTELKALETARFQEWQQQHGEF